MDEEQAKNYVDNQWQGNTKKVKIWCFSCGCLTGSRRGQVFIFVPSLNQIFVTRRKGPSPSWKVIQIQY